MKIFEELEKEIEQIDWDKVIENLKKNPAPLFFPLLFASKEIRTAVIAILLAHFFGKWLKEAGLTEE